MGWKPEGEDGGKVKIKASTSEQIEAISVSTICHGMLAAIPS